MINRQALLADLQKLLKRLEADLLERSESAEVPEVGRLLRAEFEKATVAERTAANFEDWRSDAITQTAAAWVLNCVFARFLEDNRLVEPPRISGPISPLSPGGRSPIDSKSPLSLEAPRGYPGAGGEGENRLQRARDEYELYFHKHPKHTDRDYLLDVFANLARLPGAKELFGEHNPIHPLPNWLSGDAAGELLRFFQRIDANTGELVHDFQCTPHAPREDQRSPLAPREEFHHAERDEYNTRFLGDLYQDLSEAARKKYALLQTPEFVEEFILDRTLEPALDEFGLVASGQGLGASEVIDDGLNSETGHLPPATGPLFRMIDPACGSGHFLLGAFRRILDRWQKLEPGTNVRVLVQHTLDSIHGVDINPYAIAIARFRLLLAALAASGIQRLADAPAFTLNLVCGDSLLHGGASEQLSLGYQDLDHVYQPEDIAELRRILRPGTYHAVVANPPYITPKDRALNQAYRERYTACHMKYSLSVPFMERIFRRAISSSPLSLEGRGAGGEGAEGEGAAGYTGQITANSFMKREFGKKLIESLLPNLDLTHVIDTSGAYIPGHGTPTVILFGRHRKPMAGTIRTVMGIRGEPSTPDDPSQGLVWKSIEKQIDIPGSQSNFVSVGDSSRDLFANHPWSIGGGGAAELKEQLDERATSRVVDKIESTGFMAITGEDEVFVIPRSQLNRHPVTALPFCVGDVVRDWSIETDECALIPYDYTKVELPPFEPAAVPVLMKYLWSHRSVLASRSMFGKSVEEHGFRWFEYMQFIRERARSNFLIAFTEVATHNHFVLDRGGKVFKQTAPVIKLPEGASEDDHLALLGLLNSSTACFWMKQVCHNKGSAVDNQGARQRTAPFEDFYAFNSTKLKQFPLPSERPDKLAFQLDRLAQQLLQNTPQAAIARWQAQAGPEFAKDHSLRQCLDDAFIVTTLIQGEMLLLQEDLDWDCYRRFGLISEDLTVGLSDNDDDRSVPPGNRAFEIVLARKLAAGEVQTTWFERHGMTPNTDLPDAAYNSAYREIVARRIDVIENNPEIALIEQPEYKRRWNWEPWDRQRESALREWLLNRLESFFDFDGRMNEAGEPTAEIEKILISIAKLADHADHDDDFHEVGGALQGDRAFDIHRLVTDLVTSESIPLLPVLRYKETGLRKRAAWVQTWELQRREDAGESVGSIPVPPKYDSKDFLTSDYWRLRGKLDVPKERWVSFPHCDGPDGTLMIAWAGYDHLQLARAVSAYYVDVQERLGGRDDPRLAPLLACLVELLPWLKQWHNSIDPEFNMPMGDYFEGFINEESRQLGKTIEEIKSWTPPKKARGRRKAAS